MRARQPGRTLLAALTALALSAPAASARDAVVTSFDGTKIVTHFFAAEGLKPGVKAPTVLVGHGYGMTGDTDPESTSEELFGSVGTGPLRQPCGCHHAERSLEPIAYHAGPGSRLRLQLAPATSLYAEQRSTGALALSSVDIRLPVTDLGALRRERLSVGPTRGARRARKGRGFRVRARARGAGLRGVRLVLRNRRGEPVGRSAVVNLRADKTRTVRVRVGRRLKRGRYELQGSGVTAEGRRLTGARRLRVARR